MIIHQIYNHNDLRNFTYLLEDEAIGVFCIDPYCHERVLSYLENLEGKLLAIINTHEHRDHIRGNDGLKEVTGCEVWAHQNAKSKIPDVDRYLHFGEEIKLADQQVLYVMDTQGHTFCHLCLLLKKRGKPVAIFTGDTLFNGGVGNCHNGGDPETLFETICYQFQDLPGEVLIYPGHDYLETNLQFTKKREPSNQVARKMLLEKKEDIEKSFLVTNMELEREINTFLRLENREIMAGLSQKGPLSKKQVFLKLRELRNKW